MKTKLTLFVAVLAVALFLGCASTQKTYDYSSLVEKDGKWQQESGELVTGKVVQYIDGRMKRYFHLKDGLLHGDRKMWHSWNVDGKEVFRAYVIENVDVWENGVLIRRETYGSNGKGYTLQEFNQDGSPKK